MLLVLADKLSTNLTIKDVPTTAIGAVMITVLGFGVRFVGGLLL